MAWDALGTTNSWPFFPLTTIVGGVLCVGAGCCLVHASTATTPNRAQTDKTAAQTARTSVSRLHSGRRGLHLGNDGRRLRRRHAGQAGDGGSAREHRTRQRRSQQKQLPPGGPHRQVGGLDMRVVRHTRTLGRGAERRIGGATDPAAGFPQAVDRVGVGVGWLPNGAGQPEHRERRVDHLDSTALPCDFTRKDHHDQSNLWSKRAFAPVSDRHDTTAGQAGRPGSRWRRRWGSRRQARQSVEHRSGDRHPGVATDRTHLPGPSSEVGPGR